MKSEFYTIFSVSLSNHQSNLCIDVSSFNHRIQEMRLISALIEANWLLIINHNQLESLIPTYDFYYIRLGDPLPEINTIDFFIEKNWQIAFDLLCNTKELAGLKKYFHQENYR